MQANGPDSQHGRPKCSNQGEYSVAIPQFDSDPLFLTFFKLSGYKIIEDFHGPLALHTSPVLLVPSKVEKYVLIKKNYN